jgi:hypothetical protein
MHQYLSDTEYAARALIDLIATEERQLTQVENNYQIAKNKEHHLYQQLLNSPFNDDVTSAQEQATFVGWANSQHQLTALQNEIASLNASIDAKSGSIGALGAALLQIAKQGISLVHGGLNNCPDGRSIGSEKLKNVIWQGRNQSMHYEEGNLKQSVKNCFANLESTFGSQFSLILHSRKNLAHHVIDLLGWKDYATYEADMRTLL